MESSLTLRQYIDQVDAGERAIGETLQSYVSRVDTQDTYNAFLTKLDPTSSADESALKGSLLKWAPISLKDNIHVTGVRTSSWSRMMDEYVAPYDAMVTTKLIQAGATIVGKTNMDEYAMGSSNETSYYGDVLHPMDESRIPGGSSWGAGVSVAADMCLGALGTDTAGSVRLPAALCGIVWAKPTYGRVSRSGVQAMASSFDQVGVLAKTVEDTALLMSVISGHDPDDATSATQADQIDWMEWLTDGSLAGKRFAVPNQYFSQGIDEAVKEVCLQTITKIEAAGATVEWIDLPVLEYAVPIYYIISPAEVSANLARFDGVRFGHQADASDFESIRAYYRKIRSEGFGAEVKRRILTGTYVLSAGFYDAYYNKAQKVRRKMRDAINTVYENYDAIIWPTSPSVAWKRGEKSDDPVQMYLSDVYTAVANLVGMPAISVPVGSASDGGVELPVGFQIMTQAWDEKGMFEIAYQIEQLCA